MNKYDNLLERDLWEVFGDKIMDMALEPYEKKEKEYPPTKERPAMRERAKKGEKLIKAGIIHDIICFYLDEDEELEKAYQEQNIGRLLRAVTYSTNPL